MMVIWPREVQMYPAATRALKRVGYARATHPKHQ